MSNNKKKTVKAVVISVAAEIVVAAALLAVFVIKPAVDNKNKPDDSVTTTAEPETEFNSELVEYNGVKMQKALLIFLQKLKLKEKKNARNTALLPKLAT